LPEENLTASTVGAEIGAIYQINSKTYFGIHLANPFSLPIKTFSFNEKIPYRFRVGCHTNLTENVLISVEAEKIKKFTPIAKFGIEWEAIKSLLFRVGFNSGPEKLFAGLGFQAGNFFKTDLAIRYHQYLGCTPAITITFNIK